VDLHHDPSPSHGEMHNSYTLRANWHSWWDSHPLEILLEGQTARRLRAQELKGSRRGHEALFFDREGERPHEPF